jgi:hypothetical protein
MTTATTTPRKSAPHSPSAAERGAGLPTPFSVTPEVFDELVAWAGKRRPLLGQMLVETFGPSFDR